MQGQAVQERVLTAEQVQELQREFIVKVYGWMTAGLLITAVGSLLVLNSEALLQFIFSSQYVFFGLLIGQLLLVGWLSVRIEKMSAATATTVFVGYSALNGLTLALVFLAYTAESIASTFFITAATFGAMSAYGYFTRADLTKWGSFLMMGLIGIVIASIVNLWLGNPTVYWLTTYAGILVFVGLTAYDTQKIKEMSGVSLSGAEAEQKGAILGALRLYLDFINLFLMLLRVLGNRR